MQWTPDRAALQASYGCPLCQGRGLRSPDGTLLCGCVYRSVFRSCHRKFRHCLSAPIGGRRIAFERSPQGVDRRMVWVRRTEDFIADFQSAARRVLPPHLHRVFRFYHVLGAEQTLLARRFSVSLRSITDMVAEVELLVGKEIAHMRPYSLFPPYEYMHPARTEDQERLQVY